MADKSLLFDIFAVDRASKTFDKVGEHADRMGGHFGKVGKAAAVMGTAMAGAVIGGVAILGTAFAVGMKQAEDYQKITAQTNAVLKSTKAVSHETAAGVAELSKSISEYSGISQEVVQKGANMLLTFTNVRNGVGKSNQIFSQATATLMDMTTALGEDPQKAAIQLGKALNDPAKGITALKRVGVTFDDQQVKTIKHMVAAGKTMDAQKLILKELSKEFGGSAKAAGGTLAGGIDKLKNSVLELLRDAITPLIPLLVPIVQWFADKIPKALTFAINAVKMFIGAFVRNGDMEGLPDTLNDKVAIPIINAGTAVRGAFEKVRPVILQFVGWIRGQLVPALSKAAKDVLPALGTALKDLGQALVRLKPTFSFLGIVLTQVLIPAFGKIAKVALPLLGAAFKLVAWNINTTIMPAIKFMVQRTLDGLGILLNAAAKAFGWVPGIGGKLKTAAKQFSEFRNQVNAALNGIKPDVTIAFHSQMDAGIRAALQLGGQTGAAVARGIHGSTHNASGTSSFGGGWTMVNEGGPELIHLPKGSQVKTSSETSRMLGGGGGDISVSAPLVIKLDSGVVWQGLVKFKRQSGRVSLGLA